MNKQIYAIRNFRKNNYRKILYFNLNKEWNRV